MVVKTKLRTCNICGIKKKVAEFSTGKICNKCEESTSTLREESSDDETPISTPVPLGIPSVVPDDLQSLHAKIDNLTQRFDRMESLVIGLMELMGKINYDMEINKVEDE
jgi:hypothetical protein